jgi:hypothetical protein
MPSQPTNKLTNALTHRVQKGLVAADTDGDGKVSPSEREALPADIRPTADATADKYFSGGSLPVDTFVEAYNSYVSKAVALVDTNGDRNLSEAEQQNLPGAVYSSVVALRSEINSSAPTGNLDRLYQQYGNAGWTDERLSDFIQQAQSKDQLNAYRSKIKQAVLSPKLGENAHAGDRFFEAVAWYTDKTVAGSSDGALTLNELRFAKDQKAKEYLSLAASPERADQRRQTWKNIEKLALLEKQILASGDSSYSYDPAKMMQVNHNNAWNAAHTLESAAEFDSKVREASFEKPVLVKYGLTYCMHCLLLEQLDSVHAVADKYGDDLDVYKVWWNPNDPAMAEISDLTVGEGVTSSPYFMVYKDGEVVRKGYAFPDEQGQGLEDLLNGIV